MSNCMQFSTQSVLEHGQSVCDHLFDLLDHLQYDAQLKYEWTLPEWVYDKRLLQNLPSRDTLKLYTVYHDCSKPYCLTYDNDGKKHFPNHAEKSYEIFKSIFNDDVAAQLIKRDMDVHLLKAVDVKDFFNKPYYNILLFSGLSEIHSNCMMFGGITSNSYKIKIKAITQRGKAVINLLDIKNK